MRIYPQDVVVLLTTLSPKFGPPEKQKACLTIFSTLLKFRHFFFPLRGTVIAGSFNFTKAAEEKNAENRLVIKDKVWAAKYVENWRMHAEHSELYEGRGRKRGEGP